MLIFPQPVPSLTAIVSKNCNASFKPTETFGNYYCVKSVRIRSFSGPYFPIFGLNTERFSPNAGKYGSEKL